MQFTEIAHQTGAFHEPLTLEQLAALCARAFGTDARLVSVAELGGGEFNTVYRVALAGAGTVILRVAPPATRTFHWHEANLMRHEYAIQPYLAPLGPLLPRTLAVDFTHQLIARDYSIQADMPGDSWEQIARDLAPEEEDALWRQLAQIARTIHGVTGEAFGQPSPGKQFSTWSETVITWLGWSALDAAAVGLDATATLAIRDAAREQAALLDEIQQPRLLHSDLWPFNILVRRGSHGPRITAVLDCDRVAWGDPLADWAFHMLPRHASAHVRDVFWQAYGTRDRCPSARFRDAIYEGLHASNVLAEVGRAQRTEVLPKVQATLRAVVGTFAALP